MTINWIDIFAKTIYETWRIGWWIWTAIAVIILLQLITAIFKWMKLSKSGIKEIDTMSGDLFEKFLLTLFFKLGYKVQLVGSHAGDYGTDLIIERDGIRTAVQAKRWKGVVGIKAVQEVYGSLKLRNCAKALIVTNNLFTRQARELARANGVELWDRNILANKILESKNLKITNSV
jgi:restriction system protein